MDAVLVMADDHSTGADLAWEWVSAQSWPGWRVDIVTVETRAPGLDSTSAPREWTPANPRSAPQNSHITTLRHLRTSGDPRSVLAQAPADLLVIGQRGTGLLKRLHIGSVVESLLDCPCAPLLIARAGDPVHHALIAVDGSAHARKATQLLASMPWIGSVHATVIGIDEGDGTAITAVGEAAAELADRAAGVDQRVIEHDPQSITVNVRALLEEYIKDHQFDLLVMGTKGLHGVQRLRLGSVADYLAHHAPCSILLVRDVDAN